MKVHIYVPDLECDSCVTLIERKFKQLQGIENVIYHEDSLDVEYNESLIRKNTLIDVIRGLGFRASTKPFDRKSFAERIRHFKEHRTNYNLEINALLYTVYVLVAISLLEAVAYVGFLNSIPDFLSHYGWWVLYLNISVACLGAALWHIYSYKPKRITCMVGMMIGMTVGMQTGMMIGAVIGATNGFFVGSMVGMLLGVLVGTLTGKCCGIMGMMEGAMAGLMGGTMGPMISVMMFSDHLLWFMPFYMVINVLILAGMAYMVLEEVAEGKDDLEKNPMDFVTFASACIVVTFVLFVIMVYGPKSALLSF